MEPLQSKTNKNNNPEKQRLNEKTSEQPKIPNHYEAKEKTTAKIALRQLTID